MAKRDGKDKNKLFQFDVQKLLANAFECAVYGDGVV